MFLVYICTSLLILSITWMVSGSGAFSATFISASALAMLGVAISQPLQSSGNSKIFIAQVALLCGVLSIAVLQFLNYRGVFYQEASHSFIMPSSYVKWLPNTIIFNKSILLMVALSASVASYIAASILFSKVSAGVFALKFFAVNAFAFALLGWYQIENNIEIPYGYFLTQANSFSASYYENGAATFIYMGIAASIALYLRNPKLLNALWIIVAFAEFFILCETDSKAGKMIAGGIIFAGFAFTPLFIKSANMRIVAVLLLLLSILVCAGVFLHSDIGKHAREIERTEIAKRLSIQSNALEVIKNREINGIGLGAYVYEELPIVSKKAKLALKPFVINGHPHCDILEYAIEFGFSGMSFLFVVAILFLLQIWHRRKSLGIANAFMALATLAMFAHSCIDIFLHITSTMVLFSLALAWIKSPLEEKR